MRSALVVVCALLLARSALASRILPVSIEQLTRNAELVVDGDVGAGQSFRIDGRIFTRIEVKLRGIWKGALLSRTVSVIVRGGIVDGIGQRVDGEAVLDSGDHAVLFLRYDEQLAGYRPVALEQGAFRVREQSDLRAARLDMLELPRFEKQIRELARAP